MNSPVLPVATLTRQYGFTLVWCTAKWTALTIVEWKKRLLHICKIWHIRHSKWSIDYTYKGLWFHFIKHRKGAIPQCSKEKIFTPHGKIPTAHPIAFHLRNHLHGLTLLCFFVVDYQPPLPISFTVYLILRQTYDLSSSSEVTPKGMNILHHVYPLNSDITPTTIKLCILCVLFWSVVLPAVHNMVIGNPFVAPIHMQN